MNTIFGEDGIEYHSNNDMITFFNNMSNESAITIIETAINYGASKGLYTLSESYALFLAIEKLKTNENKDTNLCDINNDGTSDE